MNAQQLIRESDVFYTGNTMKLIETYCNVYCRLFICLFVLYEWTNYTYDTWNFAQSFL